MNNKIAASARLVLGLLTVGALAWLAYVLASHAFRLFAGLQSETSAAIIAAAGTVLVSLVSLLTTKYLERRNAVERENRLKKIPVYEELIAFIFRILHQGKPGYPQMSGDELIPAYAGLTEKMIVWGSDAAVKAFGDFRVASLQMGQGQGLLQGLVTLEDLMRAIRKDLGYENAKLVRGDILRLFINDLEQYQEALKAVRRA